MMSIISVFTAAHPYLSGLGIWIVFSVIAAGIWAMCKQRDDADDVIPAAPGLVSERRKLG